MALRLCMSGVRGFFRPYASIPARCLSTPLYSPTCKQEATISPFLRDFLAAQIRENAKQAPKVNACNFNCLPLPGTREHKRMMKAIFEKLKNSEPS